MTRPGLAPKTGGGLAAHRYHAAPGITLYLGDAATALRHLPADSVDCVVTSPPYWRLRDYDPPAGHGDASPAPGDQIGLEPTLDAYLDRLRAVFVELGRVLTPAGTVWLNLADSYAANSDGYYVTRGLPGQPRYRPRSGLPDKNLLGLPWRVALALQADGWILRNAIVWEKPHAAPTRASDRLTCRHELLFLLAPAQHHLDLTALQAIAAGRRPADHFVSRSGGEGSTQAAGDVGDVGDVWTLAARPTPSGYPPAFPLEIPLRCIAAGARPGGVILDPFSGAGTTGLAARMLGRSYLGIDRNAVHHDQAKAAFSAQQWATGADGCLA
ncbi:site-specific DNA-methyltransferase [Frankia sp. AgB1.9]|uniref:DNA-methyltransferase n=1 Tax=unclassified Frankia TaxID=2632575 RepID=UPI001931A6E0|nr:MULTISPECIES: site-specific DNA-methyltransferase [unclassified Frankia]MBL7490565.1 site-specific DNA-methyltransferase [Frankia sp. AgW1.1]MBL7546587.1 site-specific DNA-methyltransferase [Frankia sp. AgB1.9]MBL7622970.1 site-specific DNA-methyltransferase [Frankia sp. AgB1.8]